MQGKFNKKHNSNILSVVFSETCIKVGITKLIPPTSCKLCQDEKLVIFMSTSNFQNETGMRSTFPGDKNYHGFKYLRPTPRAK